MPESSRAPTYDHEGSAARGRDPRGRHIEFAEGSERFVGVVAQVVPVEGTNKSEITVEMDAAEYERMRAAQP